MPDHPPPADPPSGPQPDPPADAPPSHPPSFGGSGYGRPPGFGGLRGAQTPPGVAGLPEDGDPPDLWGAQTPPGVAGLPGDGEASGRGGPSPRLLALAVAAALALVVAGVLVVRGSDDVGVASGSAQLDPSQPGQAADEESGGGGAADDEEEDEDEQAEEQPADDEAPSGGTGDPDPQVLQVGVPLAGEVTVERPVTRLAFEGEAGQPVVLTMRAAEGSDVDPLLRLIAPDGEQLAEADDIDFPDDRDARIQQLLPQTGTWTVEATSFDEQTTGRFILTLDVRDAVVSEDVLSGAVPEIRYTWEGVAGTTVTIDMVATSDATDPLLVLIGPDGQVVAEDDDGGEGLDARIEHVVTASGTHTVVAGAYRDAYGPFALTISDG